MIGDILQPTHLLFILVVALIVLGPKRLPEVGRALGRGLRDFRNALNTDELRDQMISPTTTSTETTTPTAQEPTEASETPVSSEPATAPSGTAEQTTPSPDQTGSADGEATAEPPTAPLAPATSTPAPDRSQ